MPTSLYRLPRFPRRDREATPRKFCEPRGFRLLSVRFLKHHMAHAARLARRLHICTAILVLAGCTNANRPLNPDSTALSARRPNRTLAIFADTGSLAADPSNPTAPAELRPVVPDDSPTAADNGDRNGDGYFTGIAISGGGSRSANFAAACFFQLERIGLMKRVDYISSVSGGSLTAAYYCAATDADWNPANVQAKLTHSFATDVLLQTFAPWDWFALAFSDFDRSDMLARTLRDHLFTRRGRQLTFADLRPDRPRLLVNATDLQTSRQFVFCNESFDRINSDLSRYPLAYAVAASSSVPVVLHPVTLRDYSTTFKQYRHLIDGGVVDNLGVRTLIDAYTSRVDYAARHHLPDPYPNGIVLIVLDAHVDFDAEFSSQSDLGVLANLKTAAGLTGTLLDKASSATFADLIVHNAPATAPADQLRGNISKLKTTGVLHMTDAQGHSVRVFHVSLPRVAGLSDVPFRGFAAAVNNISTYFNIEPGEAYRLYQAAEILVRDRFEPELTGVAKEMDQHTAAGPR